MFKGIGKRIEEMDTTGMSKSEAIVYGAKEGFKGAMGSMANGAIIGLAIVGAISVVGTMLNPQEGMYDDVE